MRKSLSWRYLRVFVCWLVSTAIWLAIASLVHKAVMTVSLSIGVSHWALGLVEKGTIILVILGWLILAMVGEPYYHKGIDEGDLGHRFLYVTLWQMSLSLVLFLIDFLLS